MPWPLWVLLAVGVLCWFPFDKWWDSLNEAIDRDKRKDEIPIQHSCYPFYYCEVDCEHEPAACESEQNS